MFLSPLPQGLFFSRGFSLRKNQTCEPLRDCELRMISALVVRVEGRHSTSMANLPHRRNQLTSPAKIVSILYRRIAMRSYTRYRKYDARADLIDPFRVWLL